MVEIKEVKAITLMNIDISDISLEEAFDEIQVVLSYLQKTLGISAQEVKDHYYLHEAKLKLRQINEVHKREIENRKKLLEGFK